jgi:hypothetical protein
VLLLTPSHEGTKADITANIAEIRNLLEAGLTVGDAVLARTKPKDVEQLGLFS